MDKLSRASFLAALAFAITTLAGCATTPRLSEADKASLYRTHAGEPVGNFRIFGRLDGWSPLGDEALAVWTRPNEAYLLELTGTCHWLDSALAISLSNQMNTVYARHDSVIPRSPMNRTAGSAGPAMGSCRIDTIRPLQVAALREAEQGLREAMAVERSDAS